MMFLVRVDRIVISQVQYRSLPFVGVTHYFKALSMNVWLGGPLCISRSVPRIYYFPRHASQMRCVLGEGYAFFGLGAPSAQRPSA
jgi:hypothetical protein